MKILAVTTWLPTSVAAESGIFVERDIDLLARDHDVHVVHLAADAGAGEPAWRRGRNWSLETIPMRPVDPSSVRRAAKALRVLAAEHELVHSMAPSALLPFRRIRVEQPWVHTEHWSGILAPRTLPLLARLALPATLRSLRRPDVVVAVGERLAEVVSRGRGGPVVVIPNAVTRPERLVDRRPMDDRAVRLVGVGGLVERKGAEIAVAATAALCERGWDATLTWAGDGPLRARVAESAANAGIADRVTLLGSVDPVEVSRTLAGADVFILPTSGETFGVSIAEALAAGRPVVVGDRGGHTEFVAEPDGVLVPDRTATAYADAVERIVGINRSRSAADVARATAERFTDDRRRTLYADVYSEAVRIAHARR